MLPADRKLSFGFVLTGVRHPHPSYDIICLQARESTSYPFTRRAPRPTAAAAVPLIAGARPQRHGEAVTVHVPSD